MGIVRRGRLEDIEQIADIWMEMMVEHCDRDFRFQLSPTARNDYVNWLGQQVHSPDSAIYVEEDNQRVRGYIFILVLDNPPLFELKKYGFVGEMAVLKTFRHQGLGKKLWQSALKWFRRKQVEVVQLNVSPVNQSGYQFWTGLGFNDFLKILWYEIPTESENG